MKVRWTKDSVRLRITPSELEMLERHEIVRETLEFPGSGGWSAAILPGAADGSVQLVNGSLLLRLSVEDLQKLSAPETEGVYFQQSADPQTQESSANAESVQAQADQSTTHEQGYGLRYYVEKDFPCVHPRAMEAQETPSETFAAPEGFEARKTASA